MRKFFLEALDSHTNKVFRRELDAEPCPMKAEHGRVKTVIECTVDKRDAAIHSKADLHLRFKVWTNWNNGDLKAWHKPSSHNMPPKKPKERDFRLVPKSA